MLNRTCNSDRSICLAALTSAIQLVAWQSCAAAESEHIDATAVTVITATRIPDALDLVPANITVIRGDELRARGVIDLGTALRLVAGVEAPAGGDTGPAGAVPSFWGLHEFDAFLLVVDGVPWGGAFNPAIPALNLNNVERIEVLKGAAPVTYGATSFVGVIHVIHYSAGQGSDSVQIGLGNQNSMHASMAKALSAINGFDQTIAVDGQKLGFSDSRESIRGGNLLYRGAGAVGNGNLRVDANITLQRQVPPSPVVRQGATLTSLTPLDANFNPAYAGIEENRLHLVLGYSLATPAGLWDTTASFTRSHITDIRGFLRSDLSNDGSENADSQQQQRKTNDVYVDSHFSKIISNNLSLLFGADLLYGLGKQTSVNGAYYAPLNGAITPPRTTDLHVDEINSIVDRRAFFGQYAQLQWKPNPRWSLLAGMRLNETQERKTSSHEDGFDSAQNLFAETEKSTVRPGGAVGANYRAWQQGADEAVLYADYRNTFKPAAIDFGPDFTPNVLNPETAQSYETGVKGALLDGQFSYEVSVFLMKFRNLVLQTTGVDGGPILQNAGGERLRGAEVQTRYRVARDLSFVLNASYHEARFTEGVATEGGADIDLVGKQLTLSPHLLASSGFIYSPPQGINAAATVAYVGRRYLDLSNLAPTSGYTTLDTSIGYRQGRYSVALNAYNVSNKRPPVTQSEFGDSSYYRLHGRRVFLNIGSSL